MLPFKLAMENVQLGSTGTRVSKICLGTMGFGDPAWRSWVIEADEAIPLIDHAIDQGVNFIDTANMYSRGRSEEIVGEAIRGHRDDIVLATKAYHPMGEGPNEKGLSRKHVLAAIDASLERLGTDHVDLYQTHRFDHRTPIDETLSALDQLVRDGKTRYVGASTMWAWQFATMLERQRAEGMHTFVTMQNHYNLLYREEEREMVPLCRSQGVGLLPWSPLARGDLAHAGGSRDTERSREDPGSKLYAGAAQEEIKDRVASLAEEEGVEPAQIALAWLLGKEAVTAPIVGVTRREHIDAAVEAASLNLSEKDARWLEEPYEPQAVRGWLRGGGVPGEHLHALEPDE